jgi:hypothetical protein
VQKKKTTQQYLRGSNHIHPRELACFELDLNSSLNLDHLCFNEKGISVTFGMVVTKDIECFFPSVLADEISRTLWKEAMGCR